MQAALTHDKLSRVNQLARAITDEVGKAFIGSPAITESLLTALLARGHAVTAIDAKGHESARSTEAAETVPAR